MKHWQATDHETKMRRRCESFGHSSFKNLSLHGSILLMKDHHSVRDKSKHLLSAPEMHLLEPAELGMAFSSH